MKTKDLFETEETDQRKFRRAVIALKRQGSSFEEIMLATPNLYVVYYHIRETSGNYLVNAKNKKEASQIIRTLTGYTKITVRTLSGAIDKYGKIEYFIPRNGRIPEPNQAEFIEQWNGIQCFAP